MTIINSVTQLYKEAYTGHSKQVWTLTLLTFINRMGTMVVPFLAVYLNTYLEYSLQEAGILTGVYGVGAMLGAYASGKLSDKYGSRTVIISSLLVGGVLMINLQWFDSFIALMFMIAIAGTFAESYRPAVMSAMGKYASKEQSGRTMSLMRLAISAGMSMAPTVGGFLAVTYGYNWLFWADGITCIVAALLFWSMSYKWDEVTTNTGKSIEEKKGVGTLPPQKNSDYLLFLAKTFLVGIGFIQWFNTVPVFIKSEWHFDERYIGLFMGISSIIITIFELPVIHYLEKHRKTGIATSIGLSLIGLSFLPFFLPPSLIFYLLAMLIWTVGMMIFLPFNNAMPIKISPANKSGDYMGWYWMTWSLTAILGPVIGFSFIQYFGYELFWIGMVFLAFLGFLLNNKLRKMNIS